MYHRERIDLFVAIATCDLGQQIPTDNRRCFSTMWAQFIVQNCSCCFCSNNKIRYLRILLIVVIRIFILELTQTPLTQFITTFWQTQTQVDLQVLVGVGQVIDSLLASKSGSKCCIWWSRCIKLHHYKSITQRVRSLRPDSLIYTYAENSTYSFHTWKGHAMGTSCLMSSYTPTV